MKIKLGGVLLTGLLILLSGCIIQEKESNSDIKIAKDYMANVSVDGLSGFVVLDDASQIPHKSGDLKDPVYYKNVIRSPIVVNLTTYSKVTLYAWTYKGGLVSKWDLTIKNGKVSFVRAEAIDIGVGNFAPVGFEEYLPTPGGVFMNESLEGW